MGRVGGWIKRSDAGRLGRVTKVPVSVVAVCRVAKGGATAGAGQAADRRCAAVSPPRLPRLLSNSRAGKEFNACKAGFSQAAELDGACSPAGPPVGVCIAAASLRGGVGAAAS